MYIRVTKNQRGTTYYHLVEAYREEGKVKQRVLLSLGKAGEGKIEQLANAVNKFSDQIKAIGSMERVDVKQTYLFGPLIILEKMMEQYGINKTIENIAQDHPKLGYDLQKTVFTMVLSRFVEPVSKLSLYDIWLKKFYPEKVDVDIKLHQIYRSLTLLAQEKEMIERNLYEYKRDLFNHAVEVLLYDLTTLRFESTRTDLDTLRRFGYSKERRSDCTQVVLGLLTDEERIPLCFEVHPGNTFEGDTLRGIIDKMRQKFDVRRFIFIADRGLLSQDNLEHLRKDGGEFIVGLRLGKMEQRIEGLYDISAYQWLNKNLAIRELTLKGDRVILTWSAVRAQRDRKTREAILEKIKQKLSSPKVKIKSLVSNENYKKYVVIEGSKPLLNEKAIEEEARRDGFLGIITNVASMKAEEIIFRYKELWRIEDAFGEIKGTLKSRPVFHWTDQRIIGHLVVCFLSYFCEALLTRELRRNEEMLQSKAIENRIIKQRPLTVPMALSELSSVLAIPVRIRSKTIWVRTDIGGNAIKLFQALHLKIPPKIIKVEEYPGKS